MDINALYEAIYGAGRAPGAQDLRYWSELGDKAPAQETAQASINGAESAFQQLLGRGMQDGAIQHLYPIDQKQGMQGVRSHIAGSDEYLGRMLNNPGKTNADIPAWQMAARQGTQHQAMMPGSFWDYSNLLLSNPEEAAKIMGQPVNGVTGLLEQLLGTGKATADGKPKPADVPGAVSQGGAQAGAQAGPRYPSQSHGYTLTPEQQALLGTDFISRARDKQIAAQEKRYSANRKAPA